MARERRHPLLFIHIPRAWLPPGQEEATAERVIRLQLADRFHLPAFTRVVDDPNGFEIDINDYGGLDACARLMREIMAAIAEALPQTFTDCPGPWEPVRSAWSAALNERYEVYDAVIHREPYALLVGYWTEGAGRRKWYRVHYPVEHPGQDAVLNALLRSMGVWMAWQWGER